MVKIHQQGQNKSWSVYQLGHYRYLVGILFLTFVLPSEAGQSQEDHFLKLLRTTEPPSFTKGEPVSAEGYSEANDFYYYYQGQRIPLQRSLTEVAVRFRASLSASAKRDIIRTLALPAKMADTGEGDGRTLSVVQLQGVKDKQESETVIATLQARPEVDFVFPVFRNPKTGTKMFLTDEVVIKLKPGKQIEELLGQYRSLGVSVKEQMWGTQDEYVVQVQDPKAVNPLAVANTFFESGLVEWAEPNFIQEYQKSFVPNDPLFPQQWHLQNTGQGGGTPGADVAAPEAWNLQRGSANITIAIIDDGVELNHEDLAVNIFTNPREVLNGIDDDGNGLIDDIRGWDFINNDNSPNPFLAGDNHGTSVAGVAAASGNNNIGVSGICQRCKILPIKIFNGNTFAGNITVANAIRYAASLADILNNSWGGGSPSSAIQSAIQDATTTERAGKGAVVLFATGNSASGHDLGSSGTLPAGTHRFRWEYSKDATVSSGDDTAWLAWVVFPGGELVSFENGSPGWTTGGNAPWSIVNDPIHADEGRCFTRVLKAGQISHSQRTYAEVVKTVPAGNLFFYFWVSSELNFDGLRLFVDLNNDGSFDLATNLLSGVPAAITNVAYPAAFPEAIAVGASSNFDCRSHYSQFGPELDFVASSNGGPLNLRIVTTDRTGASGYDASSNYTNTFGGTSSATPLAAGIAGLILSQNPNLTQTQVRQLLRNTADKIGPQPYVGGRNNRYGFGRINAFKALAATLPGRIASIGVFRPSTAQWYVDLNSNGQWDGCTIDDCLGPFGLVDDLAVAGDWDGTGMAKIGVFRSGNWYLDFNGSGHWEGSAGGDRVFSFGLSNDRPVGGDWTGGGETKIGVFRPSTAQWYVDRNGNGRWDGCSVDGCLGPFGLGPDLPVAGDWNGTGIAQIGVFRNGSWYLDLNGNGKWDGCGVDRCYSFGLSSDRPVVGDWNGSGTTKVGVYRNGSWYLDLNGNGKWDGCGVDRCVGTFGLPEDRPVAGVW